MDCPECHSQFPVRMFRKRGYKWARLSCAGCVYKLRQLRKKATMEGMSEAGWVLSTAFRGYRICLRKKAGKLKLKVCDWHAVLGSGVTYSVPCADLQRPLC